MFSVINGNVLSLKRSGVTLNYMNLFSIVILQFSY